MIAAAISLVLAGQFGGSALDNALVDGDKVHLFLPPVVVSEGRHLWSTWSSDGAYLLVASERVSATPKEFQDAFLGKPPEPRNGSVEITVYNARTSVAKRLHSTELPFGAIAHLIFFPDSDVAIANINSPSTSKTQILRITCGTSKSELIERSETLNYMGVDPSGKWLAITDREDSVRFISRDGKVYPRQEMPSPGVIGWTSDFLPILVTQANGVFDVNPNGGFRKSERRPGAVQVPQIKASSITAHPTRVAMEGTSERVEVVMAGIPKTDRFVIVAYQANNPEPSPADNGIFYVANGINYVRPIIQIDKAAFDEMLAKAERSLVMSKLQQIGLALAMYASDNDDAYPNPTELEGAIAPYMRDPLILNGFVYSGPSGNLGASQTTVGYMPCPGGRAVLYQDGHVVFVPDR